MGGLWLPRRRSRHGHVQHRRGNLSHVTASRSESSPWPALSSPCRETTPSIWAPKTPSWRNTTADLRTSSRKFTKNNSKRSTRRAKFGMNTDLSTTWSLTWWNRTEATSGLVGGFLVILRQKLRRWRLIWLLGARLWLFGAYDQCFVDSRWLCWGWGRSWNCHQTL